MTTADLQSIVKAARALRAEDEERPLLLATAVNVAGSSHRRMGGRMLIAEDRWVTGSVGGGCPQGELIRKAWWFTRDGAPALLSYVARGDEIDCGLGLSSHGLVDLLLEPCDIDDPFDPIAFLESCLVAEK
jgi:xanthine dehydrogenase accessory factor